MIDKLRSQQASNIAIENRREIILESKEGGNETVSLIFNESYNRS